MDNNTLESFEKLIETVSVLRQKCPWDSVQTNQSLRTLSIEEVYELSHALLNDDVPNIKKELGDVLLHIIFYSLIAKEKNQFELKDVFEALNEKLIFRHPHIFGNYDANTPEQVSKMWEEVKLKEKDGNKTVLGGIPDALPSVIKAGRIIDKSHGVGFDFTNKDQAWDKVKEEILEFEEELNQSDNQEKREEEFGDLMFALIKVGRFYGINPDTALEKTNQKFKKRFEYVENQAKLQNKKIKELTLEQMIEYWNQAKKL